MNERSFGSHRGRWIWIAALGWWPIGCAGRESKSVPSPAPSPSATARPSPTESHPAQQEPESPEEPDRECGASVNAPIAVVRRTLTDYEHYSTILPNFGRSRVLKRTADSADVYLQVPILRGAANLWGVVRFVGPTVRAEGERIEGNYLHQGNVAAFHCVWTYHRVDDARTDLHLGLLLLPPFPLPESAIDSELNSACRDAIQGVKSHTEARAAPAPP
jgi:Polyketide cyclase / dehydrase and lipid transport